MLEGLVGWERIEISVLLCKAVGKIAGRDETELECYCFLGVRLWIGLENTLSIVPLSMLVFSFTLLFWWDGDYTARVAREKSLLYDRVCIIIDRNSLPHSLCCGKRRVSSTFKNLSTLLSLTLTCFVTRDGLCGKF